jgi:hypothetical protein
LPNTNVQRPNNRVRTESRNSNDAIYDRNRSNTESRRPAYQEKSGQVKSRENRTKLERSQPEYNGRTEQKRTETYERRPATERKPEVREGSYRKLEQQRNSSPREKSVSAPSRSRSNNEVKQSSRSVQKSEPSKKEEKKENSNRRR